MRWMVVSVLPCMIVAIVFSFPASLLAESERGDDWSQWRGPQRDGVWRESGLIHQFDQPEIKRRWSVPIGSGYSGPTVAQGRVYVTDRVIEPTDLERVHCFDWETGETLWSHSYECSYGEVSYPAGPRASVLVDDGRAYSLGATGHLYCFDAADGTVLWNHDLQQKYNIELPTWGISAAPLVEDDLLIVQIGGEDACLVALDKVTGEERWAALSDDASYSAPIMIDQAGQRVLVCWTGERIVGVNPRTGEEHWAFPFPWERWPIAIASPVRHDDLLLMSEAHKGTLLLRTGEDELSIEKVWHRRSPESDTLHCLISTPLIIGDYIYGADNDGVLRCLDLQTGEQIWEDDSAGPQAQWAGMHLIRQGDRVWLFNEQGELVIARLSPEGFEEISRAKLIDPTLEQLRRRGGVTWSHPAFAYGHVFARNDEELVCADLSAHPTSQ